MNLRLLFAGIFTISAFTVSLAQSECKPYFPIGSGYAWEYEEYDKNDALTGTNQTIVEDIKTEGSKVIYTLKGVFDGPKKKEKEHYENTFTYTCENGVLKMSLENMIPQETIQGMEGMEIEITQNEMVIPSSLNVGDKLDDATITMSISSSGMNVMNMTITISNRVVEKMETVTTPTGSYDCVVISYTTLTDMGIMSREGSGKEWLSPTVGLVKSESYGKGGALESKRILKSFTTGN